MTALAVSGLNEQQRDLVKYLVVEGRPPEEAAKLAGYHPKSVYRTLRLPAVAAAISESIQLDLASIGAPMAYRVAKSLLQDEAVSARVRADISFKLLDRAGHIAPTRKESLFLRALATCATTRGRSSSCCRTRSAFPCSSTPSTTVCLMELLRPRY